MASQFCSPRTSLWVKPTLRSRRSLRHPTPHTETGVGGALLIWANTGEKALEMARVQTPQLVLLDLNLPDMHGGKVLEGLQAQPETAHTPVIVISGDETPSQIERMLSTGARNYLTKPFEIRRFLCMFDEILAGA